MTESCRWRTAFLIPFLTVGVLAGCGGIRLTDTNGINTTAVDTSKTTVSEEDTVSKAGDRPDEWSGFPCSIVISEAGRGTPNSDELTGSEDADRFFGGEGDDTIYGLGGGELSDEEDNDLEERLIGGGGSDEVFGGPGEDILQGDGVGYPCNYLGAKKPGNDVLEGGPGSDILLGGSGEDVLRGGDGDDMLGGGGLDDTDSERDYLYCGPGEDYYNKRESIDYVAPDCENLNNIIY